MIKVKHIEEIPEEPHPILRNVKVKAMLSKRDDGAELTCILVSCSQGADIEEHVHPEEDDIIYILEGEARMWIEGKGEFPLKPGTFVVVPRGTRHRTYDVKEDLLIYDVFYPPMI